SLGLAVRSVLSPNMGAFIVDNTGPGGHLQAVLFGSLHKAGLVRILNPENHYAVVVAGKQGTVESGAKRPDVEHTRWRRSKANANHEKRIIVQNDGRYRASDLPYKKSAIPICSGCALLDCAFL